MYLQTKTFILMTLCVLTFKGALGHYSSYDYDDSYNTNNKLNKIQAQLDILTNEVSRLAAATSKTESTEVAALDPLVLVSIERKSGSEGNVFTIRYTKNFDEIFYEVHVEENLMTFGSVEGDRGDVSSLTFTCDGICKNKTDFDITFSNKDQSSAMELSLENYSTQTVYQDRFTVPFLSYKHSGDLVYNHGRDVSIAISASCGKDKGFSDVSTALKGVRQGGSSYNTFTSTDIIAVTKEKRFLETEESRFTIRVADHPISGFLDLSLRFSDNDAFLVRKIQVQRSVVVRPLDQTGPFPEDFVDLKDTGRHLYPGYLRLECQIGTNCTFDCAAVGNAAPDVRVEQLRGAFTAYNPYMYQVDEVEDSNKEWETVDEMEDSNKEWDTVDDTFELVYEYSRTVLWTSNFSVDSKDTQFKCIATTASQNVSTTIDVILATEEFYIDEERSRIHIEEDEDDPTTKNVTLECTVIGRPVKYVDYRLYVTEEGSDYEHLIYFNTESIVPLGPGEHLMRATERFEPDYWPWYSTISRAVCIAYSIRNRYTTLTLLPPDTQK